MALATAVYELHKVNRIHEIDIELQNRVASLTAVVREFYRDGPGPPPDRHLDRRPPPPWQEFKHHREKPRSLSVPAETAGLFNTNRASYFAIWYRDGTLLNRSEELPEGVVPPRHLERDTLPHLRMGETFREMVDCSGLGDCVVAGTLTGPDLKDIHDFGIAVCAMGVGVLAMGLAAGWRLSLRVIKPIERISEAASRISEGKLSERVVITDPSDELGQLACVLNSTFAELEAAVVRERRFTADAAHELRMPLTAIIAETQSVLSRERTATEYRETVQADLDTAQRMRRLTQSLLELSTVEEGNAMHESVDVASAVMGSVRSLKGLADEHSVAIYSELVSVEIWSVASRIEQLISNLLSNAIYYNRPGGEVRVANFVEKKSVVLRISDSGSGIERADLPRIFDRFYRAGKVGRQDGNHAGLGLAICKAIVDADHGAIEVTSAPGTGTTVIVRWPRGVGGQ